MGLLGYYSQVGDSRTQPICVRHTRCAASTQPHAQHSKPSAQLGAVYVEDPYARRTCTAHAGSLDTLIVHMRDAHDYFASYMGHMGHLGDMGHLGHMGHLGDTGQMSQIWQTDAASGCARDGVNAGGVKNEGAARDALEAPLRDACSSLFDAFTGAAIAAAAAATASPVCAPHRKVSG